MRVASVCSGIGGTELAFDGLAEHAFMSEIEAFPRAVLVHHFPHIELHGDFTEIPAAGPVDVLVGGTPCQSFSIAGLRRGMADERGNLALEFLRLADRLGARWVLWENVPGVLSSNGGRDFGAFLGGLAELGYGFAYRVLDAQFFRLAQRRKRVFVVGHLGDWRRAAAVLFEPACLRGDSAPRREAREGVAGTLAAGAHPSGFNGRDAERGNVAHSLRADGFDASEDGTGRGTPLVAFNWQSGGDCRIEPREDQAHAIQRGQTQAIALQYGNSQGGKSQGGSGVGNEGGPSFTIDSQGPIHGVAYGSAVRRLIPRECERLQGFPDDWTLIPYRGKPAADGSRYRALGNAFAVPVVRWIARRIAREHAAIHEKLAA